jgi:UV DNA damage repair endonuclease
VRKDGNPEFISGEVLNNLKKLSTSVLSRLVFENNDNKEGVWSIKNLYKYFHTAINIPITYDSLHRQFLNHGNSEEEDFNLAYSTWGNFQPLFHYSESADGTRKHAEMPNEKPNSFDKSVMWDCELKGKDLAIFKILKE